MLLPRSPSRNSSRKLVLLALLALPSLFSCEPEIVANTYFCGPELFCPADLGCQLGYSGLADSEDPLANSCVNPQSALPFSCPEVTLDMEPNEEWVSATEAGSIGCRAQLRFDDVGCISDAEDIDVFRIENVGDCTADDPHWKVNLRYSIASAPLRVGLYSSEGALLSEAAECDSQLVREGHAGTCIKAGDLAEGTSYYLKVEVDPDSDASCNGNCAFNRYQLFVSSTSS